VGPGEGDEGVAANSAAGAGCAVQGLGFRVKGLRFRV
jgi:hypothetical protein